MSRVAPEAALTVAPYRFWPSARLLVCTMMTCALVMSMAVQTVLSMSIVCMITEANNTKTNLTDRATCSNDAQEETHLFPGTLNYDKTTIAWLMSAMFWGNLFGFLPGGWIVDRYGTRVPLALAIAILGVVSLVSPVCARAHWAALFAVRVIGGCAQGLVHPTAMKICGRWFPKDEIQNVSSVMTAGFQIGGLFATLSTSNLCNTPFGDGGGWPISYYIWGVLSVLWATLWLGIDGAPEHQRWLINEAEQTYIVASRSQRARPKAIGGVPYTSLLSDPAIWALIAANAALRWKIVLIAMYLPTYYDEALHLSVSENGLSNMLSYIVQIIIKFIVPVAATLIDNRHWFSFTSRAKVFNTFACLGMALAMLCITFVDCDHRVWAVALPIVSVAFMSFTSAGFVPCSIRVAPPFAGTISGITMFTGSFVTIVSPYIIAAITVNSTVEEWDIVFYITVVLVIFAGAIFALLGSGEESKWSSRVNEVTQPKVEAQNSDATKKY